MRGPPAAVTSPKGRPLILLAFLLPFSVYLLVLGIVNRRPHPVLVPGTWDFAGILFAASGFLLVGGPAVLSSGSERWRMFWLFGSAEGLPASPSTAADTRALLAGIYFLVVVAAAAYLLYRRRELTAVYNVEPEPFAKALAESFAVLGLNPIRSGDLYVFGVGGPFAAPRRPAEAIQAPHLFPSPYRGALSAAPAETEAELVGEGAVLEVDAFGFLRHVTLRWEPARPALRREVEAELARTLARTHSTDTAVGDWLTLIALALIAFNLMATCGLALTSYLRR